MRIHPARNPELCITEGRDHSGRYPTAAALPKVFIEPLHTDVVQIQWHHPTYRIGCLTIMVDGPGPARTRDHCARLHGLET
ncbi:hypothetical protein GCM10027436_03240 [Actinophytocola sediminis]